MKPPTPPPIPPRSTLLAHRFTVPLDYSSYRNASPKITRNTCCRICKAGLALSVRGQRSEALTVSSMSQIGSAEELAEYLKHFRTDNIVNDAEFIRVRLVPDAGPLDSLGAGLKQVLLTGGIPPVGNGCTADTVYTACSEQVARQNEKYYKRFPQDAEIVRGVKLSSGGILTPRGLQSLGLSGLGSSAGFERLLYMFERVWDPVIIPGLKKQLSHYFLTAFESWMDFEFSLNLVVNLMPSELQRKVGLYFSWEMVFPWMFEEIHDLRPFRDAAHLLAEKEDWPPLYDITVLNNNKVPVAAAVCYEVMYVNFKLAMDTASQIAGIRLWITYAFWSTGCRRTGSGSFTWHAKRKEAFVLIHLETLVSPI